MANVDPRKQMQDTARAAAEMARQAGAQQAAVQAGRTRTVEVEWRDGRLERMKEATTRGLPIELYVDGRYSQVTTYDLRTDALRSFVEESVAVARKLQPDPFRALPDPKLYRGQAKVDLDLVDPAQGTLTAAGRRERAQAAEAGARGVKGAASILSVTTGFSDVLADTFRVHTNGFEGSRRGTSFTVSAEVSVKDADGRRPEDWDFAFARHARPSRPRRRWAGPPRNGRWPASDRSRARRRP